jgi:hypothetical protein
VVYMMASTGVRVGAWDYLKYGHITPIERDAKLVAAKILVYAGTPDSYVTFMTPETYREVEAWMKFRKQWLHITMTQHVLFLHKARQHICNF